MNIFKAAARIVLHHPVYLLVYAVWLTFMGLFITSGLNVNSMATATFETDRADYAIIDRDNSSLSQALSEHLVQMGNPQQVADDSFAMQDAVATGLVDCLFIVPEGFGDTFMDAARNGEELPTLQASYGFESVSGTLASEQADRYLKLIAADAALEPNASWSDIIARAETAAQKEAPIESLQTENSAVPADTFTFYLQWSTYTLMAAIVVCVSVLMGAFNRTDIRRRNATSPKSTLSRGLALAAGCLLVGVLVWAWAISCGLLAFGGGLAGLPPTSIALTLLASFVFALVALSIGFLLGQLNVSEPIANAVGNILGLVLSFLGGAWMSLDLLSPEVQAVAHFTPTFWFNEAVSQAIHGGAQGYSTVLADIGIVALFAVALFVIALAAGKMRTTSAAAGGNAAASRKG